jgi:hypothetical protein
VGQIRIKGFPAANNEETFLPFSLEKEYKKKLV